jgi:chromosome segregation ATPase
VKISDERLEKIATHIEEWGETLQSQTNDIGSALRELQTFRATAHGLLEALRDALELLERHYAQPARHGQISRARAANLREALDQFRKEAASVPLSLETTTAFICALVASSTSLDAVGERETMQAAE